jgi:protein TonB
MEALDYKNTGFFEGGILKGMGVSLPFHLSLIVFALAAPFFMPTMEKEPPICTVTLLDAQMAGGGSAQQTMVQKTVKKTAAAVKQPSAPPRSALKEDITRVAETEKQPVTPLPASMHEETPADAPPVTTKDDPSPAAVAGNSSGDASGGDNGAVSGDRGDGPGRGNGGGSGQDSDTVGFGGNENDPAFIFKAIPKYPMRARKIGKEGKVLLLITLCEKGHLVSTDVVEKAGFGFDEAALEAIRQSIFRPAMRNGRPVACRACLPIVFKLNR